MDGQFVAAIKLKQRSGEVRIVFTSVYGPVMQHYTTHRRGSWQRLQQGFRASIFYLGKTSLSLW